MPIREFTAGGDVIALCATKCAAKAIWITVYVRKGDILGEQDRLTRVSRTLAAAGFAELNEALEEPMHTDMHRDHPLANFLPAYRYVELHDQVDAHKHYRRIAGGKQRLQFELAFEAISPFIGGLGPFHAG